MSTSSFEQTGRRAGGQAGAAFDEAEGKLNSAAANARTTAASGLEGAARRLHRGADGISRVAHDAGEKIDASARYVREHDAREMLDDVNHVVRTHPGKSLVAALTVGILLGRAFSSE